MIRNCIAFVCATGLFLSAGCKKQAATVKNDPNAGASGPSAEMAKGAAPATPKAKGAAAVREALEKKDWGGAVGGLMAFAQNMQTAQDRIDLKVLQKEVKDSLMYASATDPKAAEALNSLRAVELGR